MDQWHAQKDRLQIMFQMEKGPPICLTPLPIFMKKNPKLSTRDSPSKDPFFRCSGRLPWIDSVWRSPMAPGSFLWRTLRVVTWCSHWQAGPRKLLVVFFHLLLRFMEFHFGCGTSKASERFQVLVEVWTSSNLGCFRHFLVWAGLPGWSSREFEFSKH